MNLQKYFALARSGFTWRWDESTFSYVNDWTKDIMLSIVKSEAALFNAFGLDFMHANVCKAHLDMEFVLHKLIIIIVVDLQHIKVAFLHVDLYYCFSRMSVIMHIIGLLHVLNLD